MPELEKRVARYRTAVNDLLVVLRTTDDAHYKLGCFQKGGDVRKAFSNMYRLLCAHQRENRQGQNVEFQLSFDNMEAVEGMLCAMKAGQNRDFWGLGAGCGTLGYRSLGGFGDVH